MALMISACGEACHAQLINQGSKKKRKEWGNFKMSERGWGFQI